MYKYIYMYICEPLNIPILICTYVCVCIYTYINIYIYIYIYTYIRMYVYVYIDVYIYIYTCVYSDTPRIKSSQCTDVAVECINRVCITLVGFLN